MQYHVFISYSRKDTHIMRRIRNDLEAAYLRVWTDEGIEPGSDSWKEAIETAILSSQVMVVLLSPEANQSKWVQREIDYAELHHLRIVPVLVRGEPRAAVPFALSGSQYLDMRKHYQRNIERLIKNLYEFFNHEITTIASRRVRRQRRWLGIVAAVFMLIIVSVGAYQSGLLDTIRQTLVDSNVQAQTAEPSPLVLRYDARTLVLYNRSETAIDIRNLHFRLQTATENHQFSAIEWEVEGSSLTSGACTQVWGTRYALLPADDPPTDVCQPRVRYWQTVRTFWKSIHPQTQFEVWYGGRLIANCPTTNNPLSILECPLNIDS